jgi:hypothetical protein
MRTEERDICCDLQNQTGGAHRADDLGVSLHLEVVRSSVQGDGGDKRAADVVPAVLTAAQTFVVAVGLMICVHRSCVTSRFDGKLRSCHVIPNPRAWDVLQLCHVSMSAGCLAAPRDTVHKSQGNGSCVVPVSVLVASLVQRGRFAWIGIGVLASSQISTIRLMVRWTS